MYTYFIFIFKEFQKRCNDDFKNKSSEYALKGETYHIYNSKSIFIRDMVYVFLKLKRCPHCGIESEKFTSHGLSKKIIIQGMLYDEYHFKQFI